MIDLIAAARNFISKGTRCAIGELEDALGALPPDAVVVSAALLREAADAVASMDQMLADASGGDRLSDGLVGRLRKAAEGNT